MNDNERIVEKFFEENYNQELIRLETTKGVPDFISKEAEYYVEVKSLDNYDTSVLTPNQEIHFSMLDRPIFIYFVKNKSVVGCQVFERLEVLPEQTKTILLKFEDKEFAALIKAKKTMTWKEYMMRGVKL